MPSPTVSLVFVIAVEPLRPVMFMPPVLELAMIVFVLLPVPRPKSIPLEFVEAEAELSPKMIIESVAVFELEMTVFCVADAPPKLTPRDHSPALCALETP